jgi:hypothetical protein
MTYLFIWRHVATLVIASHSQDEHYVASGNDDALCDAEIENEGE